MKFRDRFAPHQLGEAVGAEADGTLVDGASSADTFEADMKMLPTPSCAYTWAHQNRCGATLTRYRFQSTLTVTSNPACQFISLEAGI